MGELNVATVDASVDAATLDELRAAGISEAELNEVGLSAKGAIEGTDAEAEKPKEVPAEPKPEAIPTETQREQPAPADATAEVEPVEPKELIGGRWKSADEAVKSYEELQGKYTQATQEAQRLSQTAQILNALQQTPSGKRALAELAGWTQPEPQKEEPGIPEDPDQFAEVFTSNPVQTLQKLNQQWNAPASERMGRIESTLNTILGHLEATAVTGQLGAEKVQALTPHVHKVISDLGDVAQYIPLAIKMKLAEAYEAKERLASVTQATQKTEQLQQKQEEHRRKVVAASVETGSQVSEPGKVIDLSKLSPDEMEKELYKLGATRLPENE